LWELIEKRAWHEAGALLREDAVIYWPHTGELIKGRANYIEVNRNYPEGWQIQIVSVIGHANRASIEVRVPHERFGVSVVAGFYELAGGMIVQGTEYWVDEKSQAAPNWRAGWTERR